MAKSKARDLPPIQFTAAGKDQKQQQANLDVVTPSPGFPTAAHVVFDAIEKRSITTVFDFTPQIVNIRYHIDGIWHNMPPMDRETGDYMMATLKQLAGMNYRERRARQQGAFQALVMKHRYKCRLLSQGVRTGERIALYINIPEPPLETLDDMGIRPKLKEPLLQVLNRDDGILLVSAMPGEGFTATWRATLASSVSPTIPLMSYALKILSTSSTAGKLLFRGVLVFSRMNPRSGKSMAPGLASGSVSDAG